MKAQSQDLEHGGKPPEAPPQEPDGGREGKHDEHDKGSRDKGSAAPKGGGDGAQSATNPPSRPA